MGFGCVDAGHGETQPRHRLGDQTAAAADIDQAQAAERVGLRAVAAEPLRHAIADVTEANRIEPMERFELAVRIPPGFRDACEAFDLGRVDGNPVFGRDLSFGRYARPCPDAHLDSLIFRVSSSADHRCGAGCLPRHCTGEYVYPAMRGQSKATGGTLPFL